ncbi:methionyl-tRNA formyltransferase [Rheinheimera sp.]|uniref:methionyl-tRNA formyltransferase n=1 Tax=Rheinheimera sp. TaxID=1869214 RepID=UPI002733D868|nr:methionyl-tRNA formyltransferase [Rheinheimera sp.]MDP2715674.1 methionyl-tRNA formyltransferase [Rheinheimera sp.]
MRIGYFADGPWSHRALELISKTNGLNVVFIVPRYDTQDPELKKMAEEMAIPFIPVENVNTERFLNLMDEYKPDLLVSMSFNQILRRSIIDYAPLGFINCHAGALPFYRGRNPLNWVLINGESNFGITVHYVEEGIDTGDIVEQRLYPISLDDNYGSLLHRAIKECANVLHSAILKIAKGEVEIIKQTDLHPVGTYFGIRTIGDEWVDFNWPAERVHNFVRAISKPGPCARFIFNAVEYAIERTELIENAPNYIATVGEVVGKSDKGIIVKVGDSTLLLTLVGRVLDGAIVDSKTPNFRIGSRFNNQCAKASV